MRDFVVIRTRPDRCPGVLALYEAGDGWLARVRLPGGRLRAPQLRVLAEAADLGGNVVQLTARANLQLRGLRAEAGEELAALLAPAGLLPSRAHERVRNVLSSPLAGRHPDALAGVDEVVEQLDRELCADPELARLPRKFLFLVEDGSGVLDGVDHDLALVAIPGSPADGAGSEAQFALLVAGLDSGWRAKASGGPPLALVVARFFQAERGDAWRVRELPRGGQEIVEVLEQAPSITRPVSVRSSAAGPAGVRFSARAREARLAWGESPRRGLPTGRIVQRDGRIAVTAHVPHGRLRSAQLRVLAQIGAEARVSPWHTLSLVDLPRDAADQAEAELVACGLALGASLVVR